MAPEEVADYTHMCYISDSSVYNMLEGFFADWHQEQAVLDSSYLDKWWNQPPKKDVEKMRPLFHFVNL